MNRYKKLLSNTAVFAAGQFLSKAMVYLLMPLYTAVLTKEQSSAADMVQQVGNFLMPVAALGLCEGILRFAMDSGVDGTDPVLLKKKVFSSSMTMMFLSTLLFAALAPLALLFSFDAGYVWLTVGFVVAANLQMAVSYYVRSLGHTAVYAVQGIINTALTIVFNVIFLVWLRWGVTGFILAITIANLLVSVILIIWMKLWRDFEPGSIDRKTVKALLLYSLPLIPTTVMWSVTNITDKQIVISSCGEAVNGMFVYSYKIPTVLTLITTIFVQAWQLSSVRDSDDRDRGDFFTRVFASYNGVIFMAASFLTALTKPLTRLLLDESYFGAWEFIPVLIFATVFSAFATFTSTVYMVRKKSLPAFLTALAGASANILLSLILAPFLGAQGVAAATAASYILLFGIRAVTAKKYVAFSVGVPRLVVNSLLLAGQCVIMVTGVKYWQVWQGVIFAAIVAFNAPGILAAFRRIFRRSGGGA